MKTWILQKIKVTVTYIFRTLYQIITTQLTNVWRKHFMLQYKTIFIYVCGKHINKLNMYI